MYITNNTLMKYVYGMFLIFGKRDSWSTSFYEYSEWYLLKEMTVWFEEMGEPTKLNFSSYRKQLQNYKKWANYLFCIALSLNTHLIEFQQLNNLIGAPFSKKRNLKIIINIYREWEYLKKTLWTIPALNRMYVIIGNTAKKSVYLNIFRSISLILGVKGFHKYVELSVRIWK